jgi:hypothetical protein
MCAGLPKAYPGRFDPVIVAQQLIFWVFGCVSADPVRLAGLGGSRVLRPVLRFAELLRLFRADLCAVSTRDILRARWESLKKFAHRAL